MIIYLMIMFLFTIFFAGAKYDGKWILKKDKDDIKVYVRTASDSGLPEFKGVTKIAAPMSRLVAVLRDVEEYPNLFPGTKAAKLLEKGKDDQICYMHYGCPFPVSDRDGIYRSSFYQDIKTGISSFSFVALPDYLPKNSDKVRINNSKGLWTLTLQSDGLVEVVFQQYADLGGNIPNWLIKLFSVNIPFKALNSLRHQVQLPKYKTTTFENKSNKKREAVVF